jgi:redox-sensitive bicupin YhaK (pirin superfamily)
MRVIRGKPASDGAGVKLTRVLGWSADSRHDPFLMLDEFGSDQAQDYIAGFPSHPHRGFETVTYMLEGEMLHEDHLGNQGRLGPGSVQWMTAGRGIIHSEMPQQEEGRMRGFQLWINLPAREKMCAPAYRDIQPDDIPRVALAGGGLVKVIAGTYQHGEHAVEGPVRGISTVPLYLDIALPPGASLTCPISKGHNAFVYTYEGSLEVAGQLLERQSAGLLGPGEKLEVSAGDRGASFLVLAARPLNEPVAQYGPFVMNTSEELKQAIHDYQSGTLTSGHQVGESV